ncbi:MAG: hypothetical protein IT204_22285 [Fimbriimonadaceae bacterium]|nr:hypothetical protein [Fimbriimonadaceae bacterium]
MEVVPEFEQRPGYPFGVLPDGVHRTDEPGFRARFVAAVAASATRSVICDGFFRLRAEAVAQGIGGTQWVDGSFVESKVDPGDVDVVTFTDYDGVNALPQAAQESVGLVLAGRASTQPAYWCHTFLVLSCDASHEYFGTFERHRAYWRKWFGRAFDKEHPAGDRQPEHTKGLVSLALGDAAQAPVISVARS